MRADADGARSGIKTGALRPPGFGSLQAHTRFPDNFCKTSSLLPKNAASERSEPIIAATGIVIARARSRFLNPPPCDHFLQIVVERAGSNPIFSTRLARNFLHDAVAVEILAGERKQDMQRRRGQRK